MAGRVQWEKVNSLGNSCQTSAILLCDRVMFFQVPTGGTDMLLKRGTAHSERFPSSAGEFKPCLLKKSLCKPIALGQGI